MDSDIFSLCAAKKQNEIQLVFDAGPHAHRTKISYGKVLVMYAGQGHSADDLIKELLLQQRGQDILLVTSDREIRDFAKQYDIISEIGRAHV